ncbi:MAG: IS1380 family transposase [Planctomycetota bacterium]|jgi:hypothetical protein
MSEYTKQLMFFKEISGKTVEADFDGGDVSSDAGVLFLRETESDIGIINKVAKAIVDNRHQSYVKHEIVDLLTQRVFQIASGYEDGNDSDELRNDPIFKMSCDKLPASDDPLASQPTMCRFENTPSRTTLYRIAEVILDAFIGSYNEPPEGIILDIDDTADATYGIQQLTLFNAYHDCFCYMPLHIYEGKSGKLITTILRPGKRPSGKEIVSILKRIVARITEAWPEVGILIRGDDYYSSPDMYDYCREHNIKYVFGFKPYKPLLKKACGIMAKAKELYEISETPVKLYSEFPYQAATWSEPLRIIVKAEFNHRGPNTRFIVTNIQEAYRKFVYETVYCGRGATELMIKEHKNHLASDRTSCSSFQANQFRLFLHSIAYILMHTFRDKHLKHTEFAKAQFNTIQKKFIKVGARVRQLSTKIKIHLPSSFPLKYDYQKINISCYTTRFS